MKVNFNVLNQKASPAIYAAPFANRPAAGFAGRIFIDTDNPSTGIYRDTGSAWISLSSGGGGITGSGTANKFPMFTGSSVIGDSALTYVPGSIGVAPQLSLGTNYNFTCNFTGSAAQPIGFYIYEGVTIGFNFQRVVGSPNYNSIYSGTSDIQIKIYNGSGNFFHRFYQTGNVSINSETDNGNRLQVTGTGYFSGNVGIGTTTPGAPLDIHGTGTIAQFNGTGTNNAFVYFQNAGANKWRIGNNYSGATNYFSLFDATNSVETLKITQGAGVTSLATYQGRFTTLKGYVASGSTGTIFFQASPSAANELCFYAAGTVTGNVYMTYGNINATGTVYQYVSNTNNANTTAHAVMLLSTNSATGGDPFVYFQNGVTQYLAGMANADNDIFKIQNGTAFTATPAISVFTNNRVAIGSNTDNGQLFQVAGSAYISSTLSVGTSTINSSAIAEFTSTTKGVRVPVMTTTQKNAITTPASGLVIFDTTLAKLCIYTGSAWETVTSA